MFIVEVMFCFRGSGGWEKLPSGVALMMVASIARRLNSWGLASAPAPLLGSQRIFSLAGLRLDVSMASRILSMWMSMAFSIFVTLPLCLSGTVVNFFWS